MILPQFNPQAKSLFTAEQKQNKRKKLFYQDMQRICSGVSPHSPERTPMHIAKALKPPKRKHPGPLGAGHLFLWKTREKVLWVLWTFLYLSHHAPLPLSKEDGHRHLTQKCSVSVFQEHFTKAGGFGSGALVCGPLVCGMGFKYIRPFITQHKIPL